MESRCGAVVAEAYRILRMNLEALRLECPLQVLLLTPVTPREAAGEVAVDLGVAFAEAGRRTLLVDADGKSPDLCAVLRISPSAGFHGLLSGAGGSIDAALVEAGIPGLWVLPAGSSGAGGSPPLRRLGELISALRRRAERILIYAPPVQHASWTLALAEHSDGVLLIAHARRTHRGHLLRAREALERIHAPVLGVILLR